MTILSGARSVLLSLALTMFGLLSFCSREKEEVAPTSGTITAQLTPAAIGYTENVVATAADGKSYTVIPDANTGAFSFAGLPPGAYVLTFTMRPASVSPISVPVTVVAGAVARPQLPVLTRDGRVRGTMKWKIDGKSYSATEFMGFFDSRSFVSLFSLGGYYSSAAGGQTDGLLLVIPGEDRQGKNFVGAGVYPLGIRDLGPFVQYTSYPGGFQGSFSRYSTYFAARPLGSITVTRFDEQAGVAVGSFQATTFPTAIMSAADNKIVAVTEGSFNITF